MKLKTYYLFIMTGIPEAATVTITSYISGNTVVIDASGNFSQSCPNGQISLSGAPGQSSSGPPFIIHEEYEVCQFANGTHTIIAVISGCYERAEDQTTVDININPSVAIDTPKGVVSPLFDITGTVNFGMGYGKLNFYSSTTTLPSIQSTIGDGDNFSWNAIHPLQAPASDYFLPGEHQVEVTVSACNILKTPNNIDSTSTSFIVPELDDLGGGGGGPKSCPPDGSPMVGKPVNIANGNVFVKQHDFTIPGIMPVEFSRYYNSLETETRGFGNSWSHSFDTRIITLPLNTYKVINPEGSRVVYFDEDEDGIYESKLHNTGRSQLTVNADGTFVIQFRDGRLEEFNTDGYLIAHQDRNGNRISLLRNTANELEKITGPFGREIIITNDTSGKITKVSLPDSKEYTYAYSYQNLLETVTYPDTSTKRYSYNSQKLSYIHNENNKIIEKHTYNSNHKAITSSADHINEIITIDYALGTVTDSLNRVTTFTVDTSGGRSHVTNASGPGCSECGQSNVSYSYDDYLNITSKTDGNGNITTKTYDAGGNVLTKTEASGTADARTTTYTYNTFGQVLTETNHDGIITVNTYDTNGNLLTRTEASGTVDERTTTYTYYISGLIHTVTDPEENITTNTYDEHGNLETVTNALDKTTTMTYDTMGNLKSIKDPNNKTTAYEYDLRYRLKKVIMPDTGEINYEYDPAGNRTAVIDENNNRTEYAYDDINRLTTITEANGNSTIYSYDTESNVETMTIKDSLGNVMRSETYTYDDHNRLERTTHADTTYNEQIHDDLGNIKTKRDENANITTYDYDSLSRVSLITDQATGTTSYTYDSRDNLLTVTDANSNVTTYTHDKINRLETVTSPDTGLTVYTYDGNSNMLTKTDANGTTTTNTYDDVNRKTSELYPDSTQDIYYTYDDPGSDNGEGHLGLMTDPSGYTWYDYDSEGRVITETKKINNILYRTTYTYDLHGNVLTITYPSGRIITYTYNQENKVSEVTDTYLGETRTLANNITYQPYGDIKSITYGNTLITTKTYNDRYHLSDLVVGALKNLTYSRDDNGQITGITDNLDPANNKGNTYDTLNRLKTATGQWGTLTYNYDPVDNRTTETKNTVDTIYNYTPNTNLLSSTTGVKTLSFNYDNNGNTTDENTKQFVYNQNQRLTQVIDNSNVLIENIYNGNGQRVQKWVPAQNKCTIFLYDQD